MDSVMKIVKKYLFLILVLIFSFNIKGESFKKNPLVKRYNFFIKTCKLVWNLI